MELSEIFDSFVGLLNADVSELLEDFIDYVSNEDILNKDFSELSADFVHYVDHLPDYDDEFYGMPFPEEWEQEYRESLSRDS